MRHPEPSEIEERASPADRAAVARHVRSVLPAGGLFADQEWRIASQPFPLGAELYRQIERLGRILLQFQRAANLLYRQSVEGKQPAWVHEWLDQGKPEAVLKWQRRQEFKNDLPRVIRPDLVLTDSGLAITELDSIPGGIGLTAWLNQTYSAGPLDEGNPGPEGNPARSRAGGPETLDNPPQGRAGSVIGGARGMLDGFAGIFGDAQRVHIVVAEESSTYRPEMEWLCGQLDPSRFAVRDTRFSAVGENDAVYRFFELFDLPNVSNAEHLFRLNLEGKIRLTPPPKAYLEEKQWLALLWNRNLDSFWRRELGASFLDRLRRYVPYSWIVNPAPLPPHGAIPELNLTDWHQLKGLSQKERSLILKASGFSDQAWGARSVRLGSDLSSSDWSAAVDEALRSFPHSPFILQRFEKPKAVQTEWFDFDSGELRLMTGRVRLCPYYFVHGEGDAARAHLGGILATVCPADKKIIHGMRDAVLAPCSMDAAASG